MDAVEADPVMDANIKAQATEKEPLRYLWDMYHELKRQIDRIKKQKPIEVKKEIQKKQHNNNIQICYPMAEKMEWRPKKSEQPATQVVLADEMPSGTQLAVHKMWKEVSVPNKKKEDKIVTLSQSQVPVAREMDLSTENEDSWSFKVIIRRWNLDVKEVDHKKIKSVRSKRKSVAKFLRQLRKVVLDHNADYNSVIQAIDRRAMTIEKPTFGDYMDELESWCEQLECDFKRKEDMRYAPAGMNELQFKRHRIETYLPGIKWDTGLILTGLETQDLETFIKDIGPYTVKSQGPICLSDSTEDECDDQHTASDNNEDEGEVADDSVMW